MATYRLIVRLQRNHDEKRKIINTVLRRNCLECFFCGAYYEFHANSNPKKIAESVMDTLDSDELVSLEPVDKSSSIGWFCEFGANGCVCVS